MKLTESAFLGQQITVHELVGPEACRVQPKQSRNPQNFLYAEFSHKFLQRNRIPRNKDGTWTISNPEKNTEENIRAGRASNAYSAGRTKKLFISAAEVKHLPHVPTFGYVVREQDPPLKIDVEKATALGVKPSKKYRLLQQGFPVQSDDGTTEVLPSEVAASSSDRARKFVLLGDNCETPEPMRRIMQDADVMVHEAALHHKVQSDQERGHSSAEMAGAVAKSTRAKVLVLNHFSNRVQDIEDVQGEVERAESTNGETSVVVPAHDFMEIRVPREGFDTSTISASSDSKSE
eukprot:CAMPEP_0202478952 /NCGR_PEP_ID=MMETSP1360-20130828/94732_1 /ASSEMBLY_ACC=CAM_ASM_000848 /TAXON_ID=515479 /ORGANISM="Licmophora paradoxa, Strain CCMP2313" /LENGTH=290 /DNA_ID=CAMNT_0049106259 /DNA_START=648 /DNA_END=1520 /DNA_ORIENTATION=-